MSIKFVDKFFSYFSALFFLLLAFTIASLFLISMSVTEAGNGILRPLVLIPVKAKVSGLIEEIYVADTDSVSTGDTLMAIGARDIRNNLQTTLSDINTTNLVIIQKEEDIRIQKRQMQGDIQLRKAELKQSEFEEEQKRSLWEIDSLSSNRKGVPYDLKIAETQKALSEIKLSQVRDLVDKIRLLELDLQLQETKLSTLLKQKLYLESIIADSYILSPMSGTVLARDLQLKHGDFIQEGATVLEIAVPGEWIMRTAVTDKAIPFIRKRMHANIFLEAFPYLTHRVFHGTVIAFSVDPSVSNGRNEYVVDVQISGIELDPYLRSGYHLNGLRGSVKFVIDRKPVALCFWDSVSKHASKAGLSSAAR